jgi:sarcosine oxidase
VNVAVVGLGGIGSAAAYWLARRGATVTGFEQFELGHARGASHDHSRIIRRSYHTLGYVELAAAAYDAWAAVEAEAGHAIITRTGGIDLFPPDAAIDPEAYTSSLAAAGVLFEWIDGAEVARRWPPFAAGPMSSDAMAIFQADTGIVPAARATETLQRLATGHGARLLPHTPVRAIRPVGDEVDVKTDDGVERFAAAVLACDAWVNRLLGPLGSALPLVVLREQVSYFSAADLEPFQPGRFPVWIWMDDPSFYGFPVFGDRAAVKAAEDCGGAEVDPDARSFDPDPAAEDRVARFMRELVGDVLRGRPRSTTCLYTLTADRDFVLDRLPDHPQVLVALGAAHGFKFASWFGRVLTDLVVDGHAVDDLSAFSITRPALFHAAGRDAWLV